MDRPWEAALREDTAVELPAKHCALKGCSWSGSDEAGLQGHLCTSHRDAVEKVASLLPKMHSEAETCVAAYDEAIAVVVRRGAPLASYSIDRRCLLNCASCLSDAGPQSLVCFSCARRFPYIPGWQRNEIWWVTPLTGDKQGEGPRSSASGTRDERFCGLSRRKA